ncbi:MAG: lytic transglycosylase domain-containing protein [Novosphingobium sp.]|nr:lytic transglycosylase domain-containing protein [Novosphingobium sp.]
MQAKSVYRLTAAALALGAAWASAPAAANSASADYFRLRGTTRNAPAVLTRDEREFYATLFASRRREDWAAVQAMLAAKPEGPLHAVAKAEFYLAANSPKVDAAPLVALIGEAPELPWADQLARLAAKRGASELPALPGAYRLYSVAAAPKRLRPRSVSDGTMPPAIADAILLAIKNDDPTGARALLDGIDASLSSEARAEWRARVAWSFYIENDDGQALSVARSVADGSGPWVAEGWWTVGLAAWRLGGCEEAAAAFEQAAAGAGNADLAAAGHYWAGRAWLRCRAPEKVAAALRAAARRSETFYGLLAAEALDLKGPTARPSPDFTGEDWQTLRDLSNVRAAAALAEIGENDLADELLRHQARIGDPRQFAALTRLARDLGLASTQLWMAYNAPSGGRPDDASRYPTPKWAPANGWKVDPALAFAHALQESNFRTSVTSPANAKGLMQITPITVRQHSPALAMDPGGVDLTNPSVNLAFGQQNLQMLRDSGATQGLLPKIMAAYNAGLTPLTRWNYEIRDHGDPLLWIESIPYWETRGYVSVVMRNYWMYEQQAGAKSDSRKGLAEGKWPRFPGLSGAQAVRIAQAGR